MPTSDELLELANQCATKLEDQGYLRHVPSFSDAEEQCEKPFLRSNTLKWSFSLLLVKRGFFKA